MPNFMNAIWFRKCVGTLFVLASLLLETPISKARMQCAEAGQNNDATEYFKFDVVPCVDEERDRSNSDTKSHAKSVEEAASLTAWIVKKTGWALGDAPPVHFIPFAELVKFFTGGKPTTSQIEALYSEQEHSIYLPDSWRPDALRDRSILLHELVHHLQYLNKVKVTCSSEYELQAVKLQVTWLLEQGVEDPLHLLGINELFIRMLGQCE